ncbi:hypothetical protein DM01DRAFT_1335290 [Hesseltinella vesiculosa]|uniref:Protein Zds1 C-terminal domain-containing protein n=1 Tax=Hesseltinella vesiculosa TaxID=101127 RepID=A0A1X2GJ12_9FUNG|nr:hypothetical protein DM01DRAFT_1335290 [Hesseltinella vesiculosa]
MDSPCSVDYFGQLPVLDAIEPGKLLDLDALEWKLANANLSSDDDKDHSDSEETSPSPRSISTSSLTTTIVTPPDTQDKTSILLSPTPTRSKLKLHWLSQLLDKNKKKKKTTPPQHTHPTQETKALTWSKKKIASLGIRQVRAAPPTTAHALLPDYSREPRLLPSLERSIYRLSYTKCSQQRPLREQVMITNFMFWYLDLQGKKRQRQPSTPSSSPTLVNEKMPPVDVFPGKRPLPNRRASSHKHSLLGRTRHQ